MLEERAQNRTQPPRTQAVRWPSVWLVKFKGSPAFACVPGVPVGMAVDDSTPVQVPAFALQNGNVCVGCVPCGVCILGYVLDVCIHLCRCEWAECVYICAWVRLFVSELASSLCCVSARRHVCVCVRVCVREGSGWLQGMPVCANLCAWVCVCLLLHAQVWAEGVCPSVCSERACLCPLGLLGWHVTAAAAGSTCYDMFIGLSTLMHFKFPTQGGPGGLQSHLFLA